MHWATWDRSGEHEVSCGQQWSALAFPKKALFCRVCRSVCGRNWGWAELLRLVERNQDWALVRTKGIKKKAVGPLQRPEKRNLWGFRGMHERLYHTLINQSHIPAGGGRGHPTSGLPFWKPLPLCYSSFGTLVREEPFEGSWSGAVFSWGLASVKTAVVCWG